MSGIARLNLALIGIVLLSGALYFILSEPKAEITYSALASPYCADHPEDALVLAKAGFVKDLKTGSVIFEKNADAQLPLASLTKLATVLTAMDTLAPDDHVSITRKALEPEGTGLSEGELWRAEDLIDYTLVASVNDGAHALALGSSEKNHEDEAGFIARMNMKVKDIGMLQTYFTNDTGLDMSETSGSAYGSARDIASLFEYIAVHAPRLVEGSTADAKVFYAESGQRHIASNTSSVIGTLAGAIASKTGYTDLAGGNLGIVFEPIPGRPVAAVVLGSTREERDNDIRVLVEAAKKWERRTILCSQNPQ